MVLKILKKVFYIWLILLWLGICFNTANGQQFVTSNEIDKLSSQKQNLIKYPITGDNPFPFVIGKELEQVEKALFLAKELTKNCECDKALQDYGVKSLFDLLKQEVNVNIFDGRRSTLGLPWIKDNNLRETVETYFRKNQNWLWAGVIQEPFTGKGNIIFLNDYFFNPTKQVTSALEQRSIILIHESVHQYGHKDDNHFGNSQRLTFLIKKACLPNLK